MNYELLFFLCVLFFFSVSSVAIFPYKQREI
jgi:hypothetical protein